MLVVAALSFVAATTQWMDGPSLKKIRADVAMIIIPFLLRHIVSGIFVRMVE
jgi:hypothetical protein